MRLNKWMIPVLMISLSACSMTTASSNVEDSSEYAAVTPFQSSDTRVKHIGLISDMDLRIQMEQGLMDLSKQHFSPSDVEFRTHTFLDFDTLDATDGSRGLLGTRRDGNPNGLNPSRDEPFDTGNGEVSSATILVDIYELDWYQNNQLKGISLGLVVNDQLDNNGTLVPINEDKLKNYIEVTSNKLVTYMRERFNEVKRNVPIYVAAYELNHIDDSSKGSYIYEGYFQKNQSQFKDIDEEWVVVPSATFTEKDPETADEFSKFQQDVAAVLPDQTYVIADAKFENKKLNKLNITVTAHGKTASEILAVTQTVREGLSKFSNTECNYYVEIYNDDEVYVMIQRPANTTETHVISKL